MRRNFPGKQIFRGRGGRVKESMCVSGAGGRHTEDRKGNVPNTAENNMCSLIRDTKDLAHSGKSQQSSVVYPGM